MKMKNKIGVIVHSFRAGMKEGLHKAKALGADGVQIFVGEYGLLQPDKLSAAERKYWKSYIESLGLDITGLIGDTGEHGFQVKSDNARLIEQSKRDLDFAVELGTNIVTTHIGTVPDDTNGEIYEAMLEACEELGVYASSMNAYFAIETGPETAADLKRFLDRLSTKGVSVNFDPANMVMITGDDPVQGLHTLKDYIVHTHAKDGLQLYKLDRRLVYGSLEYKETDPEKLRIFEEGNYYKEVPLGEGSVKWDDYIKALADIGYTGYVTIEREVGNNPEADIAKAIAFLKKYRN